MSTIYLIRHGMTQANERHLYCGSTDLPLSGAGVEALKQKRYDLPHVRFVTSGMKRTEQTLQILFGEVPHEVDDRFREVDFGAFEMGSYEQLKDDPAYQQWITGDNESNVPPNGESGRQMRQRVLDAFEEMGWKEENVAIITHGGVIAAIMEHLFPEEPKNRYQWQPRPGEGYAVTQNQYTPIGRT